MEHKDSDNSHDPFATSLIDTGVTDMGMQVVSEVIHTGTVIETGPQQQVVSEAIKKLLDEIRVRFPEFIEETQEDNEDLPYLTMGNLVDWLDSKGKNGFDSTIVQRLVDFAQWCELQPRGEDASDDIYTVLVVALYEGLFLHQHTTCLISRLMSKADLEANKQYIVTWVGQDNYDKALEQF